MRAKHIGGLVAAVIASAGLGVGVERFWLSSQAGGDGGPEILYWVAPMDPNFRRDGPGKSPMGMDLVPVYEGEEPSGDPSEVRLSATEINAIGVRTAVARIEPIGQRIETVGFVSYDEHLTSHIHLRVEGWIEDLKVRAVGERVSKGDFLFEVYAPQINVASFELLRAIQRGDARERRTASSKLRNFGMSERQIEELTRSPEVVRTIDYFAPQDGVVIGMDALDGAYLKPETRALSLSDLSSVWVIVDVFERDIGRLSPDKVARARFEHLPGRVFEGVVDYIYPELDVTTRTLPVRLRFDNAEGLLRPNMYATVALEPGAMREAVTVPSEAVIRTGRAERVILKTGEGTFRPRLVTTGLRDSFGDAARTEILQGLAAGEEVVASAQFLIDSESALNAGFLRMAPTADEPAMGKGELVALDLDRRRATVRHDALESLDWPAMETEFGLHADITTADVSPGDQVEFEAIRGADGLLALIALGDDDGVDAVGAGEIHAVTADGKLTLSHEPIPSLGWPAMTMDLPVRGFDPTGVPLDAPVEFDLAKGEGGLFLITAVRPKGAQAPTEMESAAAAKVMTVEGVINAIDPDARRANATHGPLAEIGMPGMTMDFPLAPELDIAALSEGEAVLRIAVSPEGELILAGVEPRPPVMRASGSINAVNAEAGVANATHGPLAEIGMPGMTMDFPLAPALDPASLPIGEDVTLLLRKEADFSLTIVGVEPGSPQ